MIEQSSAMYGGTCINIGCIPSKVLVHDGIAGTKFDDAFSRKQEVVQALNQKLSTFSKRRKYKRIEL